MRWKPLNAPRDQEPNISAPPPQRLSRLTEWERWMAGRERQTERKVGETLPADPSPHTDAVVPLHGREVSPAPSLPRMLMQPPLPGNRLMGVAQGLGTRNV